MIYLQRSDAALIVLPAPREVKAFWVQKKCGFFISTRASAQRMIVYKGRDSHMTAKRKRRLLVLAVVFAAACLFHAPILRGLARLLIVDQPTDDYDCVCISPWGYHAGGDRCYDVAAELHRRKPSCRVLLVATAPNRLEEIGVMPSFEATSRRQLLARHVPAEAVTVLRGEPWNDWANAEALAAWMNDHPGHGVLLLSDQFHSGQMRPR